MKLDGYHLPDSFCQLFLLCEYWAAQTEAGKDLNSDTGNWFCRLEEGDFLQPANAGYFWLYLSKRELDLCVGFDFFLQLMKGDLSIGFDFFLQLMKVSVFMRALWLFWRSLVERSNFRCCMCMYKAVK